MAAKKSSSGLVGGILLFLGAIAYLYVVFTWYSGGSTASPWLTAAQFLSPFVAALAIVSSISLFFMSIGTMAGKMADKSMMNILWRFIMLAAVVVIIVTAGGQWFYVALLGFILTYLGGMLASM